MKYLLHQALESDVRRNKNRPNLKNPKNCLLLRICQSGKEVGSSRELASSHCPATKKSSIASLLSSFGPYLFVPKAR